MGFSEGLAGVCGVEGLVGWGGCEREEEEVGGVGVCVRADVGRFVVSHVCNDACQR